MKTNRAFIGVIAVSGLILAMGGLALALAHARPQDKAKPPARSATQASTLGLMRSLNTAEYAYRRNFGHFASLDDLLYGVNYISHTNPRVEDVADDGTDIVSNLKAVVILSPEKDAYTLAVYDKDKDDKGYATFSDPVAVIYEGYPLGTVDDTAAVAASAKSEEPASLKAAHLADINLIRTINTAEVTYNWKFGHFADFDALNAAGLIKRYGNANVTFAKSPDVLSDLKVVVLVPAAQDKWSVALHDNADKDHPLSAFSDSTGIIYNAEPLH
jgi:hypothetical protein